VAHWRAMPALNVFVVEDSGVFRDALAEALAEIPATVVGFAEDEAAASAWLDANACDLVIIDLWLRAGSGFGLLRALHGAPRRFRWVVLSSFVDATTRSAATALGADGVFDKASDMEQLVAYGRRLAAPAP
jgi:DNA-binding NarL/FixJ family response regulator